MWDSEHKLFCLLLNNKRFIVAITMAAAFFPPLPRLVPSMCLGKSAWERATRIRACNYVKIETGRNFLPVLKIVTHTVQAVNVAKRARDQWIFSIGGKFRPDYGLLLELHALTLVARSYVLLLGTMVIMVLSYEPLKLYCTFRHNARDLQYLIQILAWLLV